MPVPPTAFRIPWGDIYDLAPDFPLPNAVPTFLSASILPDADSKQLDSSSLPQHVVVFSLSVDRLILLPLRILFSFLCKLQTPGGGGLVKARGERSELKVSGF